jgi:tetratricopeptide (TPR) repeat protein
MIKADRGTGRRIDTTDQDLPAELDSPGSLPGQLIAYWKMRAKFKPQDYATVKSLVNAFTDSGLYDEASAYWTEVARVDNSSPIRDLSLFGDLLVDAFLEDGQTEKAMEIWRFQFKMQTDNFSLPSGLRKNVALRCEAINACKSRLREDPGDFEAAESLQGLWEEYQENEETRFGFWKGILRIGGECNHVVIHEVRDCFTQMGDLKSEVQFWKALVLDYPDAEMLFNQLDRALTEQGDDMACFSFWGKMVRRHPRVVHIAYYFVEAARFVNMEAAVNTWKNWLEYFLSGQAVYSRIECCRQGGFTIRSIVACLDRAFDDHSQAIEFWEESLRKYPDWPPPKLQRWHGCLEADPRREAMARVLLACSYEEETDQSIRTLERAAKICPTYDEVSAAFFEACKKIDNLQIYFECWNALASSDFSTIANLRLVQYHLQMRSEYTDILNYLCRINTEKLMYKHRDVLMKGVNQWLLGSDVRGAYCFWLDVVTANCSVSYVECLIEASKASKETEKALDVLKELFLKDPNNLALGQCLENAFRANRVTPSDLETEILFWKDAVRQQLAKNEPINNICSVLSSAFKFQGVDSYPTSTVDEREACQQKVVGFWKSIVEESMGNLQNVVDELELAFKSRVLALEDNLPRLGEVWTEAIEFWEEMLLRSPQSQLLKTKLKTARDLASCLGFILDK